MSLGLSRVALVFTWRREELRGHNALRYPIAIYAGGGPRLMILAREGNISPCPALAYSCNRRPFGWPAAFWIGAAATDAIRRPTLDVDREVITRGH